MLHSILQLFHLPSVICILKMVFIKIPNFKPIIHFMNKITLCYGLAALLLLGASAGCKNNGTKEKLTGYDGLVKLFNEWRAFEKPPTSDGVPDYSMIDARTRIAEFELLRGKLMDIDTTGWSIPQQVDWHLLWAEMNGYAFNQKVLRPWERDPAFYKTVWTERSDVPAHEGPTHHAVIELWQYPFPLNAENKIKLASGLKAIPAINRQAKKNLTGNAKDLWITGISDIQTQSNDLKELIQKEEIKDDSLLMKEIHLAIASTDSLVAWLEKEALNKKGASGIGKENYSWFLRNVLLVPMNWEEEVSLMKRELARAWSSLKLEEHRNRQLPPLEEINDSLTFEKKAAEAVTGLMAFLEKKDIVTVKDYFLPALQAHKGKFIPKDKRHFFWIATHYDPRPLYSHFYHWFELGQMDLEPHNSVLRRGPLLYNIFCSHNEGMATAAEEIFMQAGLYDDNPRVREIVYIMLAQRAARGLGSLYAHANQLTMEEAGGVHMDHTPRGWMKTEKDLQRFEQQLYLRQPGYGTSYITGKYLIEELFRQKAENTEKEKGEFSVKGIFDGFNASGNIPVTLVQWELTGDKHPLSEIMKTYKPLK